MVGRVVEQVAQDALESDAVDVSRSFGSPMDLDGQVAESVPLRHPVAQFDEVDRFGVEVGGARVEPGQLEQVDDHRIEAADLADHHIEGLLRAVGQVGPFGVEYLDGRRERGDRRAQLVADVGSESLLAFDTCLYGVGHVVEGTGESVEIGVVRRVESGVERTLGERLSGVGDSTQRSQQTSARRPADERREQGCE